MYLWLLYILRLFIGLFSGHIGLVSPDLQHNLPSVPTQKRYYIQNGSHKYCISDKVHADDDEVRDDCDDTCGFTPPATGYRSLTGRQAPVKLQCIVLWFFISLISPILSCTIYKPGDKMLQNSGVVKGGIGKIFGPRGDPDRF